MKKIILLSMLSLPAFYFAQTSEEEIAQKLKNKSHTTIKPTVVAGSKQYDLLKADGKLSDFEVVMNKASLTPIKKTAPFNVGKQVLTTPCEYPSMVGTAAFPMPSPATSVNDDKKATIALPFSFCFYGASYTSVNVFDNGNVQFNTNSTGYTSTGFPSNAVNMIAPFWADGTADVIKGGVHYGKVLVDVHSTYVVITWDSLPFYQGSTVSSFTNISLLNTFQLVLTNGTDPILPVGKNVGFYYRKMQWTTGTASGGANGFPLTQPGNPATVGANQGNGVDFFQMGRFGIPGSAYDGPNGNSDGVSWLNGKKFFFDLCPAAGSNFEPVSALLGYCDTVKVCGNDTIFIKNTFLGPEAGQVVTVTATAPTLGSSFSYSTSVNPNGGTDIYIIVDGSTASPGYHTISISATDNGVPALTNGQQLTVYVDQVSVNNLNGSVAITPTLGTCPGGVVTASVTVSGGTPGTYLWSNGSINASTTFTTIVAADSLIFVTLTSGQCSKTIIGDININPVPVADISGILNYCNGGSGTVLTATNTLNPTNQGPHTYAWSTPSGTLSSTTSPTVNVNAGVYTVTVTNQFGCKSSTSTTVVMNETPIYTLTPTNAMYGSVFCVSLDTARVAINYGGSSTASCGLANSACVSSNTIQIGTSTTSNTNTGDISPYGNFDKNTRQQYLFTAAELISQGLVAGKISSLGFIVNSINPLNTSGTSSSSTYIGTLPNYTIKLKCTSATSLTSAFDNSGLVQVFNGNYSPVVGINTHNFSQAYVWDGASSLLVDICYNLTPIYTSNPRVLYTATSTDKALYYNDDITVACGTNNSGTTSLNRPNVIFGNCLVQQSGSQFNVVVTPSTGVVIPASNDSIKFPLPGTASTTCYTVSLINPIGSCTKDTVICITAAQGTTQGTLAVNNSSVCLGQPVTLTAQGALATYTIQYIDGSGIQTTTVSPVTFNVPSTIGMYTYTLNAVGPCGAPLASFTNTINVVQGVTQGTLSLSADTLCPGSNLTLSALGSLASYTIAYVDGNGNPQALVNGPANFVPASTSSPVFGVHTYSLIAEGPCSGPLTVFTNTVYIRQGTTNAALVATPTLVCVGTPVTLTASGPSLATYTITYNNGTLVNSINNPAIFNTAVVGTNIYTLQAQGACSAPIIPYTASVSVSGLLNLSIAPMANVTKCSNGTVTLTANVASSAAQPYSYNWSPAVGVSTNSTYVTSAPVTTTFVVTVSGTCANPATASVVVNNYASDINVSIMDSAAICANTALVLNTSTSGGKPYYSYNWTVFPDVNSISTSPTLSITAPATEGTYMYMVTSTDSCGFTDSDSQVITVLPPCSIEIPNIITPNGDGANDYFKIKNIEYHPNSSLSIFDRWGKKVYSSSNYANEWKAEGLNDGTFFYIIEVPDDKKYNGFVQVLR